MSAPTLTTHESQPCVTRCSSSVEAQPESHVKVESQTVVKSAVRYDDNLRRSSHIKLVLLHHCRGEVRLSLTQL